MTRGAQRATPTVACLVCGITLALLTLLVAESAPAIPGANRDRAEQPLAQAQRPSCVGDCSGDGSLTVDEILVMVNIVLSDAEVSPCPAGDANHDGQITIDEILTAVNNALNGCSPLATATPTPQLVRIDVGAATGPPGGTVQIPVTIQSAGFSIVATGNDISYPNDLFHLDVSSCVVNPSTGKTLAVSTLLAGADPAVTTVRAFMQSLQNSAPIPDGTLYTCTFDVKPSAPPGCYPLRNSSDLAFAADGSPYSVVTGEAGAIGVSLVGAGPCTPQPVLQFIQWDNTGLAQADAVTASSADIDVVQNLCVSGSPIVEPFTQTVINAVFMNNEGSDIFLRGYSTQIGNPLLSQANIPAAPNSGNLAANITGGRCSNGEQCIVNGDCALLGQCVHSETRVSGIVLFDFFSKAIVYTVTQQHPEILGQAIPLTVTFFGFDANRSFTVTANYLVAFRDFDNCPATIGVNQDG